MSLFCFLVVPVFIAFNRSVKGRDDGRRGLAAAFVLGLAFALLRLAIGDIVPSGLFGFLRWVHFFVDSSALPALAPLGAWLLLRRFNETAFSADPTDFALTWLVPVAAIRAVAWSVSGDPVELVLAPLLWISIAVGVPLFADAAESEIGIRAVGAASLAVLLPCLGATASWAFFANRPLIGFFAVTACAAPTVWLNIVSFRAAKPASILEEGPVNPEAER